MTDSQDRPVVLAVDDAPEILALVAKALAEDYYVLGAGDAGAALDFAAGHPRPNLILLDVDMPGASGFDVMRVLKSEPNTADIPVLFLSGRDDAAAQVLARAMEYHENSAVGNRVMRLSKYAKLLAQAAGAKPELAEMVMAGAPLHDIGKLGVPADTDAAGKRFDPKLVEAFKKAFPEMRKLRDKFADDLGDLIDLDFSPGHARGGKPKTPRSPAAHDPLVRGTAATPPVRGVSERSKRGGS